MKQYEVRYTQISDGYITINALNKKDAKKKILAGDGEDVPNDGSIVVEWDTLQKV